MGIPEALALDSLSLSRAYQTRRGSLAVSAITNLPTRRQLAGSRRCNAVAICTLRTPSRGLSESWNFGGLLRGSRAGGAARSLRAYGISAPCRSTYLKVGYVVLCVSQLLAESDRQNAMLWRLNRSKNEESRKSISPRKGRIGQYPASFKRSRSSTTDLALPEVALRSLISRSSTQKGVSWRSKSWFRLGSELSEGQPYEKLANAVRLQEPFTSGDEGLALKLIRTRCDCPGKRLFDVTFSMLTPHYGFYSMEDHESLTIAPPV